MKKQILIFILALFVQTALFAQEVLYVWSLTGTELKRMPSQASETLESFPFSSKVVFKSRKEDSVPTIQSRESGYWLQGYWMKIESKGLVGYIFSADFSATAPPKVIENGFERINMEAILGSKLSDTLILGSTTIESQVYQTENHLTKFQNGRYTYEPFDGCFDHTYTFYSLDKAQVFHLALSMYRSKVGDQLATLQFFEEQNGEIKFWGTEATVEVKISKSDLGWQIFSYDCT
ncbi:hypothetical protein [Pontibacter harenae]|uniref:hypothetical protein n=1 Tax=Pontibacter harenae TaxID=2894083 RepID=UPI001E568082|nr:hypothetical protein [Pontibacter harenae]MCC9165348.1 hypothetical protein [Pontibacter harenae]